MPKILVTDCWTNKVLSVVRSLGRAGAEVHVLTHRRIAAAPWSTFVKQRTLCPDPYTETEAYHAFLMDVLLSGGYDCVMPLDEPSIIALQELAAEIKQLAPGTRLAIPAQESFETANDKWRTLQLAVQADVPVPESFLPDTQDEAAAAIARLGFPIIIKPRTSSGSRGLKKVYSQEEFDRYYHSIRQRYGAPVVQQCIDASGQGLGIGLIARNGEVLVGYSYKRLREFPVWGGPSTLRETTDNQEIKEYAARLVKKLHWTGVAMVEFKHDPVEGRPKLMEINPRFWGSLELAAVAGINFPWLLYLLCTGQDVPGQEYKVGVRCRWLLPGDVAHFLANPERFHLQPSFFRFFDGNTHYDEFKSYDIRGSVASVVCVILSIFDPHIWKVGVFRR